MIQPIDVISLREIDPAIYQHVPVKTAECDTDGLKKHFLAIFDTYHDAKAFTVKSRKGEYHLRMTREGLFYTEHDADYTKKTTYMFKNNSIVMNGQEQDAFFLKNFMSRLRHISEDVTSKKATLYEEDFK